MSPSPWAAVAVTVASISLVFGAYRFVRRRADGWALPPFGVTALTFGLAIGAFLVACTICGRVSGRFDVGLTAAALVGMGLAWFGSRGGTDVLPAAAPQREWWAVMLVQVGLLGLYGYLSWQYQMHDEHALFGHKSMVEQLRRDVYPVYYPPLPGQEARYHYGFDVLAGALARGYGLSADVSIDVVGLILVVFMGFAAAAVAADEGARRSMPLAVLAIHFGAGLAFVLLAGVEGRHPRCMTQYHHPSCNVELFPTQFLNVFQHPIAVGVPMFLVFVLLAPRVAGQPTRWMQARATEAATGEVEADQSALLLRRWPVLLGGVTVVVLGGLAVGQFVYFALGVLAALAATVIGRPAVPRTGFARWSGLVALLVVVAIAFGVALLEGGMLARNPSIDPNLVGLRKTLGFPKNESLGGILWHHTVNLGVGFVLMPIFIAVSLTRRRPQVALLTAFAFGGMLVAHLFFYARSWDIVKFPSAASFALSMLFVVVVDDQLSRWMQATAKTAATAARWGRRFGAVLVMGTGATAAVYVTFPLDGALRLYDVGRWQGDGLVRQTIDWWRSHDYDSADVIYAQSNVAKELSVFGGLSVVAEDADLYYMGIDHAVLGRQRRQARRVKAALDPEALEALGVRWLMFSDEEIRNLGSVAQQRLASPPAWLRVVAEFEGPTPGRRRRIWRVDETARSGSGDRVP